MHYSVKERCTIASYNIQSCRVKRIFREGTSTTQQPGVEDTDEYFSYRMNSRGVASPDGQVVHGGGRGVLEGGR